MREISRRTFVQGAAALAVASTLAPASALAANDPAKIGIVGKVKIPWFDNVEKGVLKGPWRRCVDHQPDDRRSG